MHLKLQEPHLWLAPTLVKAVVQFLATSVVLAESWTLWSVVWVLWGQSTLIMAEMLQWDVNVRNCSEKCILGKHCFTLFLMQLLPTMKSPSQQILLRAHFPLVPLWYSSVVWPHLHQREWPTPGLIPFHQPPCLQLTPTWPSQSQLTTQARDTTTVLCTMEVQYLQ